MPRLRLWINIQSQQRFQRNIGQAFAAKIGKVAATDLLDAHLAVAVEQDLADRRSRHREFLPAGPHRQTRNDRERQRDAQDHAQTPSRMVLEIDRAADPLDIGSDDVHAYAAPGNGADMVGGGKPRREDQFEPGAFAKARDFGRIADARSQRAGDELFGIDSAAVIADLDQDLVARLARGNAQPPGFGLADNPPRGRRFDAMIDRVADDMGERVADHLDHLAIELHIAARCAQIDLLAEVCAQIAHQPGQRRKDALDPLHPRLADGVAHVGDAGGEPLESVFQRGAVLLVAQAAGDFVARQYHVRHAVHQMIDQLQRNADRPNNRLPARLV